MEAFEMLTMSSRWTLYLTPPLPHLTPPLAASWGPITTLPSHQHTLLQN